MRPLDFEELNSLTSSSSFGFVKNTNRNFSIGQIFLEFKNFVINTTDWIFEATLELRDMKDIMNIRKSFGQLQLIRDLTSFGNDGERTKCNELLICL